MKDVENNITKSANVFCSQCGQEFGPGEHGFSHCADHLTKNTDSRELAYKAWRKSRLIELKVDYIQDGNFEDAIRSVNHGKARARKLYLAIMNNDFDLAKKIAEHIMDEAAQDHAEFMILTEEEMMEVKLGLH